VSRVRIALLTTSDARHTLPSNIQGTAVLPVADLDLLQGTLDVLVLKTLSWGPRHGYAVAAWIRDTTEDDLQVEEGALYTALHRMEKRGWIESEWGLSENNRKAKYYELTPAGRQQLRAQTTRWTRYAQAVFKVLQTQVA
jgi:PadR family transcriptional regulator PadR